MFLTERQGGSDVGANTTRAVPDGDEWRLYGEKHFCSNVDAEVFIVLARPDGAADGAAGLSTFIVPRLLDDGSPNAFHIKRLKPKLGTVGVPTAEVTLDGAARVDRRAREPSGRAGDREAGLSRHDGDGQRQPVRCRDHGSRDPPPLVPRGRDLRRAPRAVGSADRPLPAGARDARRPARRARGRCRARRSSVRPPARTAADEDEGRRLRRILVPLAKIRATREAITAASQALEIFGGNGYMEDWPMARQLRDAQCHTIWEGTENILSLDVRRAMRQDGAHEALLAGVGTLARRRRCGTAARAGRRRSGRDAAGRPRRERAPVVGVDRAAAPPRPPVRVPARGPRRGRLPPRRGHVVARPRRRRRARPSWRGGSRTRLSRRRACGASSTTTAP